MPLAYASLFLATTPSKQPPAIEELLAEYMRLSQLAADNRQKEHSAASTIQRYWKGYLVRLWKEQLSDCCTSIQRVWRGYCGRRVVERLISERTSERRMKFYFGKAVAVQKTWRAFYSRKHIFDFYRRKKYIQDIIVKNEELRQSLLKYEAEQRQYSETVDKQKASQSADAVASKMHHLLGTRSVPGVFASPPKFPYTGVDDLDSDIQMRHTAERKKLGWIEQIDEKRLRESTGLKKWTAAKVGASRNSLKVPHEEDDRFAPEKIEKRAQGPFPSISRLDKIRKRPFKPTLRVQTDFFDTVNAVKEEQRYWESLRIAKGAFLTRVHKPEFRSEYALSQEPYSTMEYGKKWFRETDPSRNVVNKDFQTIVPPIPIFEETGGVQ